MTPAFVDANVAIYGTGRSHPLKPACQRIFLLIADHPEAFMTDAEVLQEILHRYVALRMWPKPGGPAFERFLALVRNQTEPLYLADVERAAESAEGYPMLSARDLVHLAVMQRLGVTQIISADRGFDMIDDVERLDPADIDAWQERVLEGA
jgi:predicted nucleic acid-binding protein